jgi:hypothetical protein
VCDGVCVCVCVCARARAMNTMGFLASKKFSSFTMSLSAARR